MVGEPISFGGGFLIFTVTFTLSSPSVLATASSIMSMRLSTPQPPSGSISFSLAKTVRSLRPWVVVRLRCRSVDGEWKERAQLREQSKAKRRMDFVEALHINWGKHQIST